MFPTIAAFIAGAARLMLALLERCVTDLGGTYAMCDTDSMAIVASESGGLISCPGGPEKLRRKEAIRALAWSEVEAIRERFAALNPYDRNAIPGSILKLEDVNFLRCGIGGADHDAECVCTHVRRQLVCDAISAKRYALFNHDGDRFDVRKYSEHGLGHLLNPSDPESEDRDWMRTVWDRQIAMELGLPCVEPDWLERPALSQLTISGPELLKPFAAVNEVQPYSEQVKPYNFYLAAHIAKLGHPDGVDPSNFQLIAPYERDSRKWGKLPWVDKATGAPYRITTIGFTGGDGVARVKTYREVLTEFAVHPEAKSAGLDGRPCTKRTIGLLQRLPVSPAYVVHVGKESNKLEAVEAGVEHDPDEIWTVYVNPTRDPWRSLVLPVLGHMPHDVVAAQAEISERRLRDLVKATATPHAATRAKLLVIAADFARVQLRACGEITPSDPFAACAAFLTLVG